MKTCPRCGSILADNEPYCDNCGFDPDFDSDDWEDEWIYSFNLFFLIIFKIIYTLMNKILVI